MTLQRPWERRCWSSSDPEGEVPGHSPPKDTSQAKEVSFIVHVVLQFCVVEDFPPDSAVSSGTIITTAAAFCSFPVVFRWTMASVMVFNSQFFSGLEP